MKFHSEANGCTRLGIAITGIWLTLASSVAAQPVLTRSYDNARSGANTEEKRLTPANVAGVHLLRQLTLDPGDDPRIEAQPLYVPHLDTGNGTHDVLIVCTMANNVYAFDVNSRAKLWKRNLGKPITPQAEVTLPTGLTKTDIDLYGINLKWGILSTPVIDSDTNTLYVVTWSSPNGQRSQSVHSVNALDLKTGNLLAAATVKGNAPPNVIFRSPNQKQRAALLLSPLGQSGADHDRKTLFLAAGNDPPFKNQGNPHGFEEAATKNVTPQPAHGWVIAFDVEGLKPIASFCATPTGAGGGIWQGSQGPSSDDRGNVFVITSNGKWNGTSDLGKLCTGRYATAV